MRPNARRVEALERRARERSTRSSGRSEARQRLTEHLSRLAAARRGELSEEEEAGVRAADAALRERFLGTRGEGGR